MPGRLSTSDQPADPSEPGRDAHRGPDLPRADDRPARGSLAELRQRLERLPSGHPSSPYNDDGSRKPPVTRLKDLELPLPGEERDGDSGKATDRKTTQDSAAARDDDPLRVETISEPRPGRVAEDRATFRKPFEPMTDSNAGADTAAGDDKPATRPDGSWEWKGRQLTPEQSKIADEALSRCRAAEGRDVVDRYGDTGLTPSMRRIEGQLEHGRLVPETEKYALKSPDRFKEKLAERIGLQPGIPAAELTARIHDGVRYTFLFQHEHYSEGCSKAAELLNQRGYKIKECKPTWDSLDYKGINTQLHDSGNGTLFEIQFHTPESWAAKQRTHEAYEKLADPSTLPDERRRLEDFQRKVTASVPVPPGALEIPYYRDDGA